MTGILFTSFLLFLLRLIFVKDSLTKWLKEYLQAFYLLFYDYFIDLDERVSPK